MRVGSVAFWLLAATLAGQNVETVKVVQGSAALQARLPGELLPFMAVPLRQSVQKWMAGGSGIPLQAWAAFALAVGCFIVYSTMPKRKSK